MHAGAKRTNVQQRRSHASAPADDCAPPTLFENISNGRKTQDADAPADLTVGASSGLQRSDARTKVMKKIEE